MKVVLDPDKVRFVDPGAPDSLCFVHAVDLSDARSVRQFLTLWTKGKRGDWSDRMPHHDRGTYHRDPPWLPAQFPGMEQKGWSTHYHLNLPAAPRWDDLAPFLAEIPPGLQAEIKAYLGA